MTFVLQPAYGRDYRNRSEAVAAFVEGADFIHASRDFTGGGSYIDAASIPVGSFVQIRFAANCKVYGFVRGREPKPRDPNGPKRVRTVPLFDLRLANVRRVRVGAGDGYGRTIDAVRVTWKPRRGYGRLSRDYLPDGTWRPSVLG